MADILRPAEKKGLEPAGTVVLNGMVDWVEHPVGDTCDRYIGIKSMRAVPTFSGTTFEAESEVALSPSFEYKIGWRDSAANVRFAFSDSQIDPRAVEEESIMALCGAVDYEFAPVFSELSGYLWTDERFVVGGHDLLEILKSHIGEWVHLEIELFRKRY